MIRNGVVALVSGGVESLCMVSRLLQAGKTVQPVYVRCGLAWEPAERASLSRWLGRIRHPNLKPLDQLHVPASVLYGRHWSLAARAPGARTPDAAMYLPGRNVLLLAHAAIYAVRRGYAVIALGTLSSNPFGDATPSFFKRFAACLRSALSSPVRILTPVRPFSKAQLLRRHASLPLHLTLSCANPKGRRHCGRCNKCAERRRAFRLAGIPDRTLYAD